MILEAECCDDDNSCGVILVLISFKCRFIRSYGTHIIIGMAVGGQDLVCVKQKYSSPVPTADVRRRLEDLGDFLFSGGSPSLLRGKTRDGRHKVKC